MKITYRVSDEYAAVFSKPFVVAEVIGCLILIGGVIAHLALR